MVNPAHIIHYYHSDRYSFVMTFVVAALCVLVEPTTGIVVGALFALLRFASRTAVGAAEITVISSTGQKLEVKMSKRPEPVLAQINAFPDKQTILFRPIGKLSYVNAANVRARAVAPSIARSVTVLTAAAAAVSARAQHLMTMRHMNTMDQRVVIVSMSSVFNLDVDAVSLIEQGVNMWKQTRKHVLFCNVSDKCQRVLAKSEWWGKVEPSHIFATEADALAAAPDRASIASPKVRSAPTPQV